MFGPLTLPTPFFAKPLSQTWPVHSPPTEIATTQTLYIPTTLLSTSKTGTVLLAKTSLLDSKPLMVTTSTTFSWEFSQCPTLSSTPLLQWPMVPWTSLCPTSLTTKSTGLSASPILMFLASLLVSPQCSHVTSPLPSTCLAQCLHHRKVTMFNSSPKSTHHAVVHPSHGWLLSSPHHSPVAPAALPAMDQAAPAPAPFLMAPNPTKFGVTHAPTVKTWTPT